jgi:hypothetical protein
LETLSVPVCGLVPYNPGVIPESAFAPSECFVADAQQSTEEPVTSAILNFVDTAGMSSAVWLSVSEGHECTRRRILSLSDSTSEDKSYESASEKIPITEEDELPVVHELCPLPTLSNKRASSRNQKAVVLTSSKHRVLRTRKLRSIQNTGQENVDSKYMDCSGIYSEDRIGKIWIRCMQCNSWCHEECAGAVDVKRFV